MQSSVNGTVSSRDLVTGSRLGPRCKCSLRLHEKFTTGCQLMPPRNEEPCQFMAARPEDQFQGLGMDHRLGSPGATATRLTTMAENGIISCQDFRSSRFCWRFLVCIYELESTQGHATSLHEPGARARRRGPRASLEASGPRHCLSFCSGSFNSGFHNFDLMPAWLKIR